MQSDRAIVIFDIARLDYTNFKHLKRILLVEDDRIEILKFKRTISKLKLDYDFIFASNGEDALEILQNKELDLPQIILLDLNMPRFNGFDFLKMMRSKKELKYIPTIVLTTSENEKDLKKCYELGIAGYMVKPLDYNFYVEKLKVLFNYWEMNELIASYK